MSIPFLLACSSTSALKEGQQLFTGLKPIEYSNYEKSGYADSTMLEMENVLASAQMVPFLEVVIIVLLSP